MAEVQTGVRKLTATVAAGALVGVAAILSRDFLAYPWSTELQGFSQVLVMGGVLYFTRENHKIIEEE